MSSTSPDVSTLRVAQRLRAIVALFVTTALLGACDQPQQSTPADTSTATVPADSTTPTLAPEMIASGWNRDAGPFVVLPVPDAGYISGSLLRPEATELTVNDTVGLAASVADGRFELFTRGGRSGTARITIAPPPAVDSGCTAWPVARFVLDSTSRGMRWTAGFAAGRVTPVPLDSIEGLAPRDSSRLAIELTRLASAVPNDTSNTFRGLPFVVLHAWRTQGLDSGFVVATLARRINQEDSPQEERLVLVVDTRGADPAQWRVSWHERASGREEELVVAEPLLVFRTAGSSDVHLLFGRDDGVALSAAVLTRDPLGWHVQWQSAIAGCE